MSLAGMESELKESLMLSSMLQPVQSHFMDSNYRTVFGLCRERRLIGAVPPASCPGN